MAKNDRIIRLVGVALLVVATSARAEQVAPSSDPQGCRTSSAISANGANVANPPGFPEIGKWMIDPDGTAAHWLGELYRGKSLREPINVIVVDEAARDADDAATRIVGASQAAGYPVRMGHSTGYKACIGEQLYAQLPRGRDDAFSSGPFEFDNNHGRIFGPHKMGEAYVFVAAFSRENVTLFRSPDHRYASFNQARDDFTQKLDQATSFKVSGFVPLDNAIVSDLAVTTADHDGVAVLVRAAK